MAGGRALLGLIDLGCVVSAVGQRHAIAAGGLQTVAVNMVLVVFLLLLLLVVLAHGSSPLKRLYRQYGRQEGKLCGAKNHPADIEARKNVWYNILPHYEALYRND